MDDTQHLLNAEKNRLAHLVESLLIAQLQVVLSQATIYQQTFSDNRQALLAMTVLTNLIQQTIHTAQDLHTTLKMPNEHIFPAIPHIHLTPRELDVLKGVVEGMSNKEIAHALDMTIRTVKFHLDNIFSKLGVASRTAAALFAVQHGLLS